MISARSRLKRLLGLGGFGGFLLLAIGHISWLNDAAQTVQFALTATGNSAVASIWNDLFVQHANAWITGLGFLLLVWVVVKPETTTQPKAAVGSINSEVQGQMEGLSPFALMAIKHLVVKNGMTESYFSRLVMDMGFPVLTLQQQHAIGNVLPELASNTTLLTKDSQSGQWVVKPQFARDVVDCLSLYKD